MSDHSHEHSNHSHDEHDHSHDPGRGHEHSHDPEHQHGHDHGSAPERARLEEGRGAGGILFFDAPSGLAGDMVLSSLVDLGVPESVITGALEAIPLPGCHVHFGRRVASGISAMTFEVHAEGEQPERTYGLIQRLLAEAKLAEPVRRRALATFEKLAHAEAKVHGMPLSAVHFHEVGAVDAIADVVGSAAALEWLGAEVVVSPLPMGRGFVRARHGVLPLPAPATVECLAGFDTYDGGAEFEFVTPTGAAIVAANASRSCRWPAMAPERMGWGAGSAVLPDRPNVLRAVLGRRAQAREEGPGEGHAHGTHVVIETNLDDATGELVGDVIEGLLAQGALDAWATPVTMKKGRPGLTLSVLAAQPTADALCAALLRETTGIGVRRYGVSRVERPRRVVTVATRFGEIPVKVSEGPFGPPQAKPEFDACRQAAHTHGVPVRVVLQAALTAWAEGGP